MDLSFLPDWPPAFSPALAVAALALVASAAGEMAARWLHLPRMLGYLAAGAVFGAGGHLVEWLNLQPLPAPTLYGALDFAASFILFDLGHGADVTPFRPVRVTHESRDTGSQIAARALDDRSAIQEVLWLIN